MSKEEGLSLMSDLYSTQWIYDGFDNSILDLRKKVPYQKIEFSNKFGRKY